MSSTTKVLDPAFQGVGQKAGSEIRRIENFQPVPLPKSEYGKFYMGDSYIILQTTQGKGGNYFYDIHFWIGKDTSQPADWDDREYIEDPNDVIPEGHDSIPTEIPDAKANKKIKNPNYKGKWKTPWIDNPGVARARSCFKLCGRHELVHFKS